MPLKTIKKAKEIVKDLVCPPATQDLELNTKNRDAAIEAGAHPVWTNEFGRRKLLGQTGGSLENHPRGCKGVKLF